MNKKSDDPPLVLISDLNRMKIEGEIKDFKANFKANVNSQVNIIPNDDLKNFRLVGDGGFSKVYSASYLGTPVFFLLVVIIF